MISSHAGPSPLSSSLVQYKLLQVTPQPYVAGIWCIQIEGPRTLSSRVESSDQRFRSRIPQIPGLLSPPTPNCRVGRDGGGRLHNAKSFPQKGGEEGKVTGRHHIVVGERALSKNSLRPLPSLPSARGNPHEERLWFFENGGH